jgi:hypothetical protein
MPMGSDTLPAKQGAAGADCAEAWISWMLLDAAAMDGLLLGEIPNVYFFTPRIQTGGAVLIACPGLYIHSMYERAAGKPYHSHVHMSACRVA